ncbi:MAG: TRAP transporter substrate-binding protein [Betaproteobacteria bacterium]|nr:MAG: TRAP transporter substrate-binding protein [Betaproteobacteria bacterium]
MKRFFVLIAAVAAASLLGDAAAQVSRMRMQTAVPAAADEFKMLQKFSQRVDAMTNGRLKIEVLPDGAVVGAFEILDAVDKGLVESGFAWTHYWSGKSPAAMLFGSPSGGSGLGMDQLAWVSWFLEGGGKELYQELFEKQLKVNVVGFILQPVGPEALGWFKRPIRNMEDFKTRRFRTPPGIPGAIYKEMGVTAVALPGAEIIPSAERGVLDAAEWCCPVTDLAYGFQRAFKYYYLQGLHQNTVNGDVYINKTFWNNLPKDVQAIFEGAALASLMESTAYRIRANALALIELKTKYGVQVMETPPDYFPAFMAAARKVMEANAAKDPFFKKVLDSQAKFAKDVVPYWVNIQKLNTSVADAYLKGAK